MKQLRIPAEQAPGRSGTTAPRIRTSPGTLKRLRPRGVSVFVAGLDLLFYLQVHCFSGNFRLQALGVLLIVYWILGGLWCTRDR